METNQRFTTLLSLVMIVATATLGWYTIKDGGGPRVGENRALPSGSADEQDVPARLWEDPLQAVQQVANKGGTPPTAATNASQQTSAEKHTVESLRGSVGNELIDRDVCLLVVPIPDTSYPDDIETRLRLRYSIQMALADRNYAPASNNYLGYFRLPDSLPAVNQAQSGTVVPYEIFRPRKSQQAGGTNIKEISVLVIWLPENRLSRSPLGLLAKLAQGLIEPKNLSQLTGLFVLGPRSSDTLKGLIRERKEELAPAQVDYLKGKLAFFSSQATAPDGVLELKAYSSWSETRHDLARALHVTIDGADKPFDAPGSWRYFHNCIATDDQLTDLLTAELALRGIKPGSDEILVLAEADTAYGRSLPITLQASVNSHADGHVIRSIGGSFRSPTPRRIESVMSSEPPDKTGPSAARQHRPLVTYRYLRGLDQQKGQTSSNDKAAARPSAKTPEELLTLALSKQGAMALGESQLDYVDRLVLDIEADASKRNAIRAVAVLGGDIYDKMILLRSLRPRFPDAVFFTTDLDARLWHPDHLRFTRNLIVASATDVRGVHSGLNPAQIPPFRDTYQVTLFDACRTALLLAVQDKEYQVVSAPPPLIFEIGRNGPRQLVSFTSQLPDSPWPSTYSVRIKAFIAILASMLCAALLYTFNYRERRLSLPVLEGCVSFAICLVLGFGVLASYEFSTQPNAEPWSLYEGISIWPTEILRLIIVCTVLASLAGALHHHRNFHARITERYFLQSPPKPDPSPTTSAPPRSLHIRLRVLAERTATRFAAWRKRRLALPPSVPPAGPELREPHVAAEIFAIYVRRVVSGRRALRVLAATAVYFALAVALMFFLHGGMPLNTHIRGDFARRMDQLLLFGSILCFLAFVFYILDEVFITARLLDKIKLRTHWPAPLLAERKQLLRVRDGDLDGFLDVSFAAEISADVGKLIIMPFVIQFLFILSRNSYFDNWSWPAALLAIFAGNFGLACVAWGVLRHSAKGIRGKALHDLNEHVREAGQQADSPDERLRHKHLLRMRKQIENENRGAYARFFQDPALLAMLLPSGVFGIVVILCRALFSGS